MQFDCCALFKTVQRRPRGHDKLFPEMSITDTYIETLHNVITYNKNHALHLSELIGKKSVDLYGVVVNFKEPKQTKGSGLNL